MIKKIMKRNLSLLYRLCISPLWSTNFERKIVSEAFSRKENIVYFSVCVCVCVCVYVS